MKISMTLAGRSSDTGGVKRRYIKRRCQHECGDAGGGRRRSGTDLQAGWRDRRTGCISNGYLNCWMQIQK